MFQRVDFARFKTENEWEPLNMEVFDYMFEKDEKSTRFMTFPFDKYYYAMFKAADDAPGCGFSGKYSGCWMRVSLGCYSFNRKLSNDWRVVNLSLALTNGIG